MTDVAMPSNVRLGWEVDCPYRGLMPYTENDSHYFFGRDQDSRLIVDNLRAYPLSVLFGPSGVGKSSVLRAGVTRVVREHTARKHERFGFIEAAAAYFSDWRDDPRASLPRVLAAEIQRATEQDPGFRRDLLDPPAVIESCSELGLDLLIVLDQFEEFFLYHEADADAFGRVLQQLLAPGSRVSILLSIREDSLARLDELEGALPGVFDHTLRLEHLDRESASEAVLLPVERYNSDRPESLPWSVEPALVESLLDQVAAGQVRVTRHGDDDGERMVEHGLIEAPYLQLVLLRLWFEETAAGSHVLRRQTLDRLGGAEAIVREHLDRVVAAFPLEEHPVLAAVFGHLVTPGGTKIAHRASDLALMTHIEEARVRHVLNRLTQGDQRILREVDPPGDDLGSESRFEVFHDVLALAILDWRARWTAARDQWEAHQAVIHEKEAAQAQTREAHRRLRRARALLGALALLLVACLVLGFFVYFKAKETQQSLLVGRAGRELASDPATALGTALEAWRTTSHGSSVSDAEAMLRRSFSAADAELVLKQGDKPIVAATFASGGRRVVTVSEDGRVRVVDARSGKRVQHDIEVSDYLRGAKVASAALVAHGQSVAVGSRDGTAALVRLDGSTPTRLTDRSLAGWTEIRVSRDSDVVATVGFGNLARAGSVVTWDARTGRRLARLSTAVGVSSGAALSGDGTYAATWTWTWSVTSPDAGLLRVWDVRTSRLIKATKLSLEETPLLSFVPGIDGMVTVVTRNGLRPWLWREKAHPEPVIDLDTKYAVNWVGFDESGNHMMIDSDKNAIVFGLNDNPQGESSTAHDWIMKSAVSPDGKLLASATRDGEVRLDYADRSNSHPLWAFHGHRAAVDDVAFSPSGDRILSAASDGTVRVWRVPERVVDWGAKDRKWLLDARFTAAGDRFVTGSESGEVQFADAATGDVVWQEQISNLGSLTSVDPSPDGAALVVAGDEASVPLVVRRDAETVPELKRPASLNYMSMARWSPNRDIPIIAGGSLYSNQVAAWNADEGGEPRWSKDFGGKGENVVDLDFSATGNKIAVVSSDGKLRLLDPDDGRVLETVQVGQSFSVALSSDGRYAATAGDDQKVRIWDLEGSTTKPIHTLSELGGTTAEVTFSKDAGSRKVAAVDSSGYTYIWDRESGGLLAQLSRHGDAVNSLDFDPQDPSKVLTASDDGTAAVYSCTPCDLTTDQLEKEADKRRPVLSPPPNNQ